jgi:uncharacterized protein
MIGTHPDLGQRDRSDEGRGHAALVTGASSGIGRAFAELLAAKGFRLVVVARREDRLRELSGELSQRWGVQAEPAVADLQDPGAPARVAAELDRRGIQVDFLVNNAGNSRAGRFDSVPWAEHAARVQLMGVATLELSHRLLPGMIERGWGRIVNISTIGALFSGFPGDATYGSVKALVGQFTESIHSEYRHQGINCTVIFPGPTTSEIFSAPGSARDVFAHPALRWAVMRPETVARQSYAAVMRGRPALVPGRHYATLATVLAHTPKPMSRGLSRALCALM